MSELTPETRVWVAPDAYDNPTLWTDGPTPDFPRALLVRVSSNADLFDWIVGSVDALAAEKAARDEAREATKFEWRRADAAEARVAELEAGIKALADRLERDANCNWTNKTQTLPLVRTLRALTEKAGVE